MKKFIFYMALLFLLLFLLGAVYIFSRGRTLRRTAPAVPAVSAPVRPDVNSWLEPVPERQDKTFLPQAKRQPVQTVRERPRRPLAVPYRTPAETASAASVSRPAPSSVKKTGGTTVSPRAVPRASAGSGSIYTQAAASYHAAGVPPGALGKEDPARERERQEILAASASGLGSRDQRALNEQLARMSAGIDRAIAQALFPKSRREQNIEKYRNYQNGASASPSAVGAGESAAAADPVQQVTRQIAAQKDSIMSAMKSAYGASAAKEAGKIMDGFSKEMAAVLASSASPQEKQIRAAAINNKYNEKLRKLNEKEGLKKTENTMRQQNEKQVGKIAEAFGPEVASAVQQKYEEYMPKRMAVLQSRLSEEEATRQLIALEDKMQQEIEEIIHQHQPDDPQAMNRFIQAQNEIQRQELEARQRLPQSQRPPEAEIRYGEESATDRASQWERNNTERILADFQSFGPEVQQQAARILKDTQEKYKQILKEGGTATEINEAVMRLHTDAEQRLNDLRNQAIEDSRSQQEAGQ